MNVQNIGAFLEGLCKSTGNCWLPKEYIDTYLKKYSNCFITLDDALKTSQIKRAVKDNSYVYTSINLYQAELSAAENVIRLLNSRLSVYPEEHLNQVIDRIEKKKGIKLHQNQRAAVIKACNSSFMVLTGGPGTGKTFVLKFIHEVLSELQKGIYIKYAAPTGKAARRITESTGFSAETLHKGLKITAEDYNSTPLDMQINVFTVDEVSMVDIYVFNALLKSISNGQRLFLVGDTEQLPSVGPGAVLRDLIASEVIPVAKLTATFRQAGDSILFDNIMRIKNADPHLKAGDDFKIAYPKGMSAQEILLWMYKQEAKEYGIDNVLCLTPYRVNGDTCANVMNNKIQQMINPIGNSLESSNALFRKGDIVMQLENRIDCANGDVGKITKIYKNGLRVQFIDTEVDYTTETLKDLSLAYAMSIHKSQGSEAKSVITTLLLEHKAMLQRNLLYTAVTRAKSKCTLLCEPDAIKMAVANEASGKRVTLLQELIQYGNQKYRKI